MMKSFWAPLRRELAVSLYPLLIVLMVLGAFAASSVSRWLSLAIFVAGVPALWILGLKLTRSRAAKTSKRESWPYRRRDG
jgi:arginine exporter protein ArgO